MTKDFGKVLDRLMSGVWLNMEGKRQEREKAEIAKGPRARREGCLQRVRGLL